MSPNIRVLRFYKNSHGIFRRYGFTLYYIHSLTFKVKGQTAATRWQWNTTVGSLLDRPGRQGDWGYVNTECVIISIAPYDGAHLIAFSGFGILEYLEFFEDTNMEPIMAVWDGYALGGTAVPQAGLDPYIQQAKDQV